MTEEKNDRKLHIIFLKTLQPAMSSLCVCVCGVKLERNMDIKKFKFFC